MNSPGERPRFDHLLHYVPDVPEAVAAYRAAGLPAHTNDARDGFQNGGWRLDARYVEILTVTDHTALPRSRFERGVRLLEPAIEALPGPAGPLTFAVDVADAHATAARLRAAGHRVEVLEIELAEHGISFVEVFVVDGPPWWPFFITCTPSGEELVADLPPGAFERGPHDLTGLVVSAPEPEAAARALGELLGLPAEGTRVPLPGAAVTFERVGDDPHTGRDAAGGHGRLTAIGLDGADGADTYRAVELHGLRVRYRA
ncbi:VOC family protein [Streptomyces sedi]|uniref:VOC family protein n=1 Tax=Streptomyces sedi TaxID=555059 RepID=A0A5C4UZC1_9ACTN|nr:VOC family protein [Streptomyces sedi]TNM29081.1 VOC family protein [Streptomyces sedi]